MKYCTDERCFSFAEDSFNPAYAGKCESIMCQGNGYLGLRAAVEENYTQNVRNMFVAGTFNSFTNEVTELPNVADVIAIPIYINGEPLDLTRGTTTDYCRTLNMENGLMTRTFRWTSPSGISCDFTFERLVSMAQKHVIAQRISITAADDAEISFTSGIDGRVTNSGSQHFIEGEQRFFDKRYMQSEFKTTQSAIDFIVNAAHKTTLNGADIDVQPMYVLERRRSFIKGGVTVRKGNTFCLEKVSTVHTSRDSELSAKSVDELKSYALQQLKSAVDMGFDILLKQSAEAWRTQVWNRQDISIKSSNSFDQLAVRFAVYHLTVMTPAHDNRMNIGAKGLSGEGYKGHTFWDTEVFMLPYFIFTAPETARSLMEYRYNCLDGARRKAAENGYKGAMYPWESAWIDDGEVTPLFGAADVVTGTAIPILTGMIEQHITSDVAYGAHYYYTVSGDEAFMDRCGYEIIMETARFWLSRFEEDPQTGMLSINDVIGPDEYKEHVSNNAYTNHMAHWNIVQAVRYADKLKQTRPELYAVLDAKLELSTLIPQLQAAAPRVKVQKANADGIIPQDDTYLSLKEIDLAKYKNADVVGTIYNDYNMEQINEIKVSKQADVLVLLYLFGSMVSDDIKAKNFYYYEKYCLHDSSLSLSTHSILASDLGEKAMAYDLFSRACTIDLGANMKTSDAGVHAASFGGIWQCVVNGFLGVRVVDGELHMLPNLPENWDGISCKIYWKGSQLEIDAEGNNLTVTKLSGEAVTILVNNKPYAVADSVSINVGMEV